MSASQTRPYLPSNEEKLEDFYEEWCARCIHEVGWRDGTEHGCPILLSFLHVGETPKEWVADDKRGPRCSAFSAEFAADQLRCPHTIDMFEEWQS